MSDLSAEQPPPDFFEAGKTYVDTDPNIPPEWLQVFKVVWVGELPGTGDVMAFGFISTVKPAQRMWQVHLFLKPRSAASSYARAFRESWAECELQ